MRIFNWFKKRKSIERIQAYQELPGVLKALSDRGEQLAIEIAETIPVSELSTEAMQAKALKILQAEFPDTVSELNELPEELRGAAALHILSEIILPLTGKVLKEELERSLNDIKDLCKKGIDYELERLKRLG